ncbi:MAG: BCCT family transporter [Tissierellia bacterium]|nr:BCCT family transporter [Tissierellia bacterium]
METPKKKSQSVFLISMAIVALIVAWGLVLPGNFETVANASFNFLSKNFGWFYTFMMTSFIVFAVWIGFFSPYQNVKLGPDDSKPEFSNISWFAMLFSAGMGIGLVFWGIAEPLNHYTAPLGVEPLTEAAAQFAMTKSFLHWGLHPWANYCVLGLGLAYMQFRKNKPGLVSSIFIPLLGEERVAGPLGKTIDILAVFATAAGMATSLGLGTYQINSGLHYMFGIPENTTVQLIIVIGITVIYTWTAVTGVDKGIKMISNLNMILVAVILVGSFIFGPTVGIMNTMVESTGLYFQNLIGNAFEMGAFGNADWYGSWTIFYWAWWIAWAPFTGVFIARISRGRTIREFVAGVLFVPAIVSFIWFSIFGGISFSVAAEVALEAVKSTSTAFFVVMHEIPLGAALSFVAIILLFTFFITSANSATFVLGMLTQHGDLEPDNKRKTVWGILQAALALSLMIGSANGLQMLQTISIIAAFPFTFIMLFTMVALYKALQTDESLKTVQLQQHQRYMERTES